MSMRYQAGIVLPGYNALKVANAPTIGTATAGTSNCASVTFTAPSCIGGGAISSYTVFSNCGAFRNSGASSPVVVSGLTNGTSYTFKTIATNVYGPSSSSAASNSITAALPTCATYTTAGTFSWVAPTGVTSVAVVAIGGGGTAGSHGSGGGGLGYTNNITVIPGNSYSVVVGVSCVVSGSSSFTAATTSPIGGAGINGSSPSGGAGGTYTGTGGGNGGHGGGGPGAGCGGVGGGGGAGGYSGAGGAGGTSCINRAGCAGSGGSGGGGGTGSLYSNGSGGGVGLFGQGCSGAGGSSSGGNGGPGSGGSCTHYGGGAGYGNAGYRGAVRIVWAGGSRGTPSFPSTNVGA